MRANTWGSALLALSFTAASALVAHDANAAGPIDFEIAAKAGFGTTPGGGSGPNPLGFGLGGRAGLSIIGLYGGVSLINYFGESQAAAFLSTSAHTLMYGVEGGYGSKYGPLTLRAVVGVGNASETVDVTCPSQCPVTITIHSPGTQNNLYVEPGAMAMLALGTVTVGADANILILPSWTDTSSGKSSLDAAFTVHGQLGLKF
jgi:hypothetical protein